MNLIFSLVVLYASLARLFNWLSIWQQKEYRLDRYLAFLKSKPGKQQLSKVINFPLSKSAFRRPRFTPKALFIIVNLVILYLLINPNTPVNFVFFYLFIPILVIVASIPAWALTHLYTRHYQSKSKRLIQTHQPTIIGITGSYGKTTTKLLLSQILTSKHKVWTSPKSLNTPLSLPKSFASSYAHQPIIIIEFAAYKIGEIKDLTRIFPPSLATITGLSPQHLELFGSFDKLKLAKSELLEALEPGSIIAYNSSDKQVTDLIKPFPKLHPLPSVKASLSKPKLDSQGRLSFSLGSTQIKTQLLGLHYLDNLKLAITLAKHFDVTQAQIKRSLQSFKPPPQFISTSTTKSGITLINDGLTANPAGALAAINLAHHFSASHKAIITAGLIDLGSHSDEVHQQIAAKSDLSLDYFFHTTSVGSDPLKTILKSKYYPVDSLNSLKHLITRKLTKGDLLLVEGRLKPEYNNYLNAL